MQSETRTFGKLKQRASSLLATAIGEKDRSFWTKPIIDEIAESACVIDEKGKRMDASEEDLREWDTIFANLFGALAFWRGDFLLSWRCRQAALAGIKPDDLSKKGDALIQAALSASHYGRFEAPDESHREIAFRYAEKAIASVFELWGSGIALSDGQGGAAVFYAAARHWELSELPELAMYALRRAIEEDWSFVESKLDGSGAPEFWREMHFDGAWRNLLAEAARDKELARK